MTKGPDGAPHARGEVGTVHERREPGIGDVRLAGRFDTRSFRTAAAINALAMLTGLVAGYGAIGFRYLIGFSQNLLFHDRFGFNLASPLEHTRGPWVIVIPAMGFVAVAYLVRTFAREAKGHGVPEVIEAVLTRGARSDRSDAADLKGSRLTRRGRRPASSPRLRGPVGAPRR